jgi:hypothetical protein
MLIMLVLNFLPVTHLEQVSQLSLNSLRRLLPSIEQLKKISQ